MKVLIAGDFCPRFRVEEIVEKGDYSRILSEIRYLTNNVDYSIVNFECPVVNGEAIPIAKKGPNLKCSIKGVEAVKWAGFDCVTLANNHLNDYGVTGIHGTIDACKQYNIDYVGCGNNIEEASRILYVTLDNQRLAIINCCEHEFSIASDTKEGCNPLNPVHQYYAIKGAVKKADKVIVIVHGGHEHFQLPSTRMIDTYRFFIDAGADAVINHHQHCISGYEIYKGKPVFYGLGNFLFDNENSHDGIWTEGLVVILDLSNEKTTFEVHPIRQCAEKPSVQLLNSDSYDESINKLNSIIANPKKLKEEINIFYSDGLYQYTDIFEPCDNRYYYGALRRGWIKSQISKERYLTANNYIACESHRDRLLWWFDKKK